MSQVLRDARKYEEIEEKKITAELRPKFHLSARTGWMNDPNGFCYYNGEYHLFYQYHPYDSHWGPMHWGHAVSTDLLNWKFLPAAIAPDTVYDRDGCFSGSAIPVEDGKLMLLYTGVAKEKQSDGSEKDIQTQCIAIGDGVDFDKYAGNPVLNVEDLPENGSRFDFRDPKIWREEDGTYRCVAGNCDEDHDGQILLCSSGDGFKWKTEKILIKNNGRFGRMWECPDFFELDGEQVLLVSPQDMLPKDLEYHNGNGTVCIIGDYDREKEEFTEKSDQSIDYGIDFYAPQTVLSPDGRRIMIGWMQNWDTCGFRVEEPAWFGQMSIPRELHIKDGRLIQTPVRELEQFRSNEVCCSNVKVSGLVKLEGVKGRKVDMEVTVRPSGDGMYQKFAVRFAQNDKFHTAVSFRPSESVVKIDRKFSGSRRAIIHQRRCRVNSEDGTLKMRIILDSFSAEVFVNDGEHVLSATMYTDLDADGILFFADGCAEIDVTKYDLF